MHIRAVARQDAEDEKKHKIRSASLSTSLFANVVLKTRSERSQRGSWGVSGAARDSFGRLPGTLGLPGASPDRPWGVIWVSKNRLRARPGASPKRPWAPKPPQDRFFFDLGSIWDGFSQIFERFFVDFRSRRVRRRHAAESQKGVVRSSPRVLALASRSRFVLPVRLSKWLANVACSVFFRCVPTSPPSINKT